MLRRDFILVAAVICLVIIVSYQSPTVRSLPVRLHKNGQLRSFASSSPPVPDSRKQNEAKTSPVRKAKEASPSSKIAEAEIAYLRDALSVPLDVSDLVGLGDRISSFARLLQALNANRTLDRFPAIDLFAAHFPWWHPSFQSYDPWFSDSLDLLAGVSEEEKTTGFVICVNNDNVDVAAHAISSLQLILGSTLPFEVAYAGDVQLHPDKQAALRKLVMRLELVDLTYAFDEDVIGLTNDTRSLKTFAALASRHSRVIVMDADVIFLQNPDKYFETHQGLKDTGALYFHGRAVQETQKYEWSREILGGRDPSPELEKSLFWQESMRNHQESGVVFIDKTKPSAFMSLVFANYMSTWEVTSQVLKSNALDLSNKEAFWLASELSNASYSFSPTYAGLIGYEDSVKVADTGSRQMICSRHLLHLDLGNKPLWFTSGLRLRSGMSKDKLVDMEFARFTHWVKAGSTMDKQPQWLVEEDNRLCAAHDKQAERISPVALGFMHNLRSWASISDERFLES